MDTNGFYVHMIQVYKSLLDDTPYYEETERIIYTYFLRKKVDSFMIVSWKMFSISIVFIKSLIFDNLSDSYWFIVV